MQHLKFRTLFSWLCLLLVILIILIPLISIITYYDLRLSFKVTDYVSSIIYFTFYQSLLSALLSIITGSLFAYLLYTYKNYLFIKFIAQTQSILFVLPTIITVFGILSFYGNFFDIYGLTGILIGHVVLNTPIVSHIIYQTLNNISPSEKLLSRQMGLGKFSSFLASEWPIIKKNIPSLFVLVTFICFVSFTPVLILGGSPKYSTLEVSIYYSVIFSNDFSTALNLLIFQLIICTVIYFVFFKNFKSENFFIDEHRQVKTYFHFKIHNFLELVILLLIATCIFMPIIFIIIKGLNFKIISTIQSLYLLESLYNTFIICLFSGIISTVLVYNLLILTKKRTKISESLVYSLIILSPAIMAVGYYIFSYKLNILQFPNIMIVIVLNAFFVLPFTYNYLAPSFFKITKENEDISNSLNIYGLSRFITIEWPRLKNSLITAFCVSSILSASDLVVISFFGTNSLSTLTQTIYRLMGSYRIDEAYSVSLILLIYCFLYFFAFGKLLEKIKWNIH